MEEYTRKPNIACIICMKMVYRRPIELERSSGKAYCSQECYGKACRKEHSCSICGKIILAGRNAKTCSRACANRNRTGIKYTGRPLKDKALSQRRLKLRLFKERGAVCERCQYSVYQILQVHHKNRNRTNNTRQNLELLCPNCHASEHYLKK
jgi:hypothetical protein